MIKKIFAFALMCALICSCGSNKNVTGDVKELYGKWYIEEAMAHSTMDAETRPFINFGKDGRMNGNASVNTFFGDYSFDGKILKLDNVGMTRMMGRSMDVERSVSEALDKSVTIKIEGKKAAVLNKKGDVVMVLVKE